MLNQVSKESVDLTQKNIEKLKELFPEILTDGNKVNFDMLQTILGEEIDGEKERYSFTWPGKRDAIIGAQQPSKGTLRPNKEKSKNFDSTENLYIEGDNLEVLKLLQKSYNNKINVIYIDPPYNTGKDFVYKDDFKDGLNNYLEQTGQIDSNGNILSSNTESNGRYHTDWLNMIYPRLKLARNLLSEDGTIFISIDDNELENLKKVCNEIFGEGNFVGQWNWYKSATPPNLSYKIKKNIEYILCYEKNKNNKKYKGIQKFSQSNNGLMNQNNRVAKLVFPQGKVTTKLENGTYYQGKYGTKNYEINLLNDIQVEDGLIISDMELEGKFKWGQENLISEINKGTVVSINSIAFSPSYEKMEYSPEVPPNFIDKQENVSTTEAAGDYLSKLFDGLKVFDYPKPVDLIEYLLGFNSIEMMYVLDFFSGSGTTAEATIKLNAKDGGNRKFIMVQIPEKIEESTSAYQHGFKNINDFAVERINRAGEKIISENPELYGSLDVGFKYFKLDKSNVKEWNTDFDNLESKIDLFAEIFVEERNELDIVHEIMLKNGLELNLPVDSFEVDGKKVYDIAFGLQFICLADDINTNVAKAIINKRDEYGAEIISGVVFKDTGFNDNDSEKLNCIQLLKDAGFIEENLQTV